MKTCASASAVRGLARTLALFGFTAIGVAGCTPTGTSDSHAASMAPPQLQTIGDILKSDPRFADYVHVVDLAGLGHALDDAHGVTVFAPTNAAFERADPHWRATSNPDTGGTNGGAWPQKQQGLIQQSVVNGVHVPSDFAGQIQDVRAMNGSIFHVDGRQPDALSITTGPASKGLGYPRSAARIAKAELPPIPARDGIIYPVDNILIR